MSDYRIKDPTSAGKEFVVAKFNQMYNISVNYRFFKEKLDQLKRKYKKYKHLMKNSTCISVDPTTSVISASDSWWKDREVDRIVKSFKRKPPELWDVMQRCFVLYDVQSQSQYSLHQRREELLNDGQNNDETETYGGDMQDTQVQETQESEEVYRVNIDDEMRHSNQFTRENLRQNSSPAADHFQIPTSRVQQRSGLRRGSSSQRGAGTSRITARSGSQGSRRKQSFETTLTDTMTGFREFQRQSLQQLRPNSFDEDDYNEFDNAWIYTGRRIRGKAVRIWTKVWSSNLWVMEFWFSTMGNTSKCPAMGNTAKCAAMEFTFKCSAVGYTAKCSTMGYTAKCSVVGTQQWGPTSAVPQWGSSPTTHQWGSSQDAPQYIPPRNVQHGFSLETEVQTTTREKEVPVSENVIRGVSPEFTNYASTSKASRPRRRGGLFNIWGTERGLNLNETQESDSTSDN
ncbi:hypothetical protein Bca101_049011 [Brassica carinata]